MNNIFEGRKILFKALVGSHNYNLNDKSSDKDYKVFILPTFDDLYNTQIISKTILRDNQDLDIHDIRKLTNLWLKSNINFLEVLFSIEIIIPDNLKKSQYFLLNDIFCLKNEIARINLPYLYDACIGMYKTKINSINKITDKTKPTIDQYGYNTKAAMTALRILYFLQRFSNTDFTDFKSSIYFNDDSFERKMLLDIKHGKYNKTKIIELLESKFTSTETAFQPFYKNQIANFKLIDEIKVILKQIVKNDLLNL